MDPTPVQAPPVAREAGRTPQTNGHFNDAPDPSGVRNALDTLGMSGETLSEPVRNALEALASEVACLRQELEEARSALSQAEARADTDDLTKLYNRGAFERELSRQIAFAQRYKEPLALLYVDLNGFKAINDTFGHEAGDQALRAAAKTLIEEMRASDVVGRIGGDEFAVILPRAGLGPAAAKAAQLEDRLKSAADGLNLPFSASVGAAEFERDDRLQTFLARADEAMFARKKLTKRAR